MTSAAWAPYAKLGASASRMLFVPVPTLLTNLRVMAVTPCLLTHALLVSYTKGKGMANPPRIAFTSPGFPVTPRVHQATGKRTLPGLVVSQWGH